MKHSKLRRLIGRNGFRRHGVHEYDGLVDEFWRGSCPKCGSPDATVHFGAEEGCSDFSCLNCLTIRPARRMRKIFADPVRAMLADPKLQRMWAAIPDPVDLLDACLDRIRRMQRISDRAYAEAMRRGFLSCSCPDPSHPDRNPSAWVNTETGHWGCHSCGARGSVYTLAELVEVAA